MYLYECRKALELPEKNFPLTGLDEVLATFDFLVFFDDIIGSGNQAIRFFNQNLKRRDGQQLYYAAVFAFESGLNRVRQESGFTQVFCGHLISDEERAFSENSAVFPEPDVRERLMELAHRYGRSLYKSASLSSAW